MQASLFTADRNISYSTKEVGPIIIAFAFAIAMGSAAIAALVMCGFGRVRTFSINWTRLTVAIACK